MKTLTIGEVCSELGLSPNTLKAWVSRGDLTPENYVPGKWTRYTDADLRRIKLLKAERLHCPNCGVKR